jgi:hypothetical protein
MSPIEIDDVITELERMWPRASSGELALWMSKAITELVRLQKVSENSSSTNISETETLDKMYLEWSQFTSARTARELELQKRIAELETQLARAHEHHADGH